MAGQNAVVHILNSTRGKVPRFPFAVVATEIVGKKYEVSLAFITPTAMRKAMVYKKKPIQDIVASNVLAFPLSKNTGEILLCPATARRQCKLFGMNAETFLKYLFIHGLLHLKGHTHGATMESIERQLVRRFDLRVDEQSSNRN